MRMVDWIQALDEQILRLRKNILEGSGTVSHQEAIEKAEREFEIYREREMKMLESDFDKAVKALLDNTHKIKCHRAYKERFPEDFMFQLTM